MNASLPLMAPDLGIDGVAVRVTTRLGGVSAAPFASLNLADHVNDESSAVQINRERLQAALGLSPVAWLNQVHGCRVVQADAEMTPEADAQWTTAVGQPIAVLTADCLPVVLVSHDAACVGVAHAGWRGLAAGVLPALIAEMPAAASQLSAWLGPAIGPATYEVGPEIREAFTTRMGRACHACFSPSVDRDGHWLADLSSLARLALENAGVGVITGGEICSHTEADRFFSYRRDGPVTGRFATLVWRVPR
ncbi:MAG: peptidoglycan editing factor PgeF [Halieaceae bacterium]